MNVFNKYQKIINSRIKDINVKGQPIVNTPEQAINCFLSTNLDILCVGEYLLKK